MDNNEWQRQRKVTTLPGIKTDAATVLARTLDKAQQGKLKSVFISIQYHDDTYTADWSNMKRFELAMHESSAHNMIQMELWAPPET